MNVLYYEVEYGCTLERYEYSNEAYHRTRHLNERGTGTVARMYIVYEDGSRSEY